VEARRDDRSFAGRRDGRRGVGERMFSGRDSRALESVHRRAYHVGAREALHRRRVWRRARGALATRCGGRTRANARLARWRHVSSFGRMVENGRATRRNFFFFGRGKTRMSKFTSQKQRFVISPTQSRRELQTSRLGVHGVALPAAEPHAAPRAVVARLEPAHRAELPRRGRAGGGSRRRRVRRHLRRHAIEHRLVEHAGETPRALFALLRAARGPDSLAFFPFQNLPDACAFRRACRSEIERCVVRVASLSSVGRDKSVPLNDGVKLDERNRNSSGEAFLRVFRDGVMTPARSRRVRRSHLRPPLFRTRCHRFPQPPRPRCRSRARRDARRPPVSVEE
jgi:hypothetical protein